MRPSRATDICPVSFAAGIPLSSTGRRGAIVDANDHANPGRRQRAGKPRAKERKKREKEKEEEEEEKEAVRGRLRPPGFPFPVSRRNVRATLFTLSSFFFFRSIIHFDSIIGEN